VLLAVISYLGHVKPFYDDDDEDPHLLTKSLPACTYLLVWSSPPGKIVNSCWDLYHLVRVSFPGEMLTSWGDPHRCSCSSLPTRLRFTFTFWWDPYLLKDPHLLLWSSPPDETLTSWWDPQLLMSSSPPSEIPLPGEIPAADEFLIRLWSAALLSFTLASRRDPHMLLRFFLLVKSLPTDEILSRWSFLVRCSPPREILLYGRGHQFFVRFRDIWWHSADARSCH